MKKSLIAALMTAPFVVSVPVHAQSANGAMRYDAQRDAAYQEAARSGGRYGGYYGSYDSYAYPPVFYYEQNNVKRNTARRNGSYYKACPNGDPAVPINVPCPGTTSYTQPQPSRYADSYGSGSESSYVQNGRLVTVRTDANGRQTVVSE